MRYRHRTGNDTVAVRPHTPGQAAWTTGKATSPISRDIRSCRISATRNDDGPVTIDAVELHQVHPLTSRSNGLDDGVATLRSNNTRPGSTPAAPRFKQREIELLRAVMAEKDSRTAELQGGREDLWRRLDEATALLTDRRTKVASLTGVWGRSGACWRPR